MQGFFLQAPLFMAFFVPAITMGLVSEEKRSGTLEMLMTLPVRDGEVILGKFLAAMTLIAVVLAATFAYPIMIGRLAGQSGVSLDWGPVLGGYIGLLLLGAAYAGIGVMVSSWHRDQVNSILISFFLCFLLYVLGPMSEQVTGWLGDLLSWLSTDGHFKNIARGVLDVRDFLYYVSVAAVGLTIATVTLSSRRW